ncbi:MAG: type II toxin-antitoxin system VapC family toxin [Synechococcaceae cyanobacterium]|nr:type II toxin-antitoxin system VapC family toxin [Synechococcaceae cyanobacterium]
MLDNSVLCGWFLAHQASDYGDAIARRLSRVDAHAPWLMHLEFSNVLRTACRRGTLPIVLARESVDRVTQLPIRIDGSPPMPAALLSLALLQLARQLEPRDPRISKRQERFAQLAIAASLGFLLLAPLQISAGLRLQSSGSTEQRSRLGRAERQLAGLRQAVAQAASNADLSARFQALSGPTLAPAALALDQAQAQLARQREALPATDPWRRLPELLRSAGACLALAGGFAIFARRSEEELSLLQGLQERFARLRQRRGARRRQGGGASEPEEYLRRLQESDQGRG